MSVLRSLAFPVFLLSNLVYTQSILTCQVNYQPVSCPPKACPGEIVTFTYMYNVSYAVPSIIFMFPNGTCNNSFIGAAIVVDQGKDTCNGPSGSGSCGPFNAKSIYFDGVMNCRAANLSIRINSTETSSIPIMIGTRTTYGEVNITTITELFFTQDPGYPIVSVTSGLTNLTVMWISPPSGGSPDYFNVVLMNGTEVLYDEKNVSLHQLLFLNLLSNMLYGLQVVAINCASYSVQNLSASTLSDPPLNIAAMKREANGSGIYLTVSWTHVGGTVVRYHIAPKCCNLLYTKVNTQHCKALNCLFSMYINISGNYLNFVTVSSVNDGGVGPESKLVTVAKEITNGDQNIVAVVTLAVLPILLGLGLMVYCWRRHRNYSNVYQIMIDNLDDVTIKTRLVHKSSTEHATSKLCINLPLKSTQQDNVSPEEVEYIKGRFRKSMMDHEILSVSYVRDQRLLSDYVKFSVSAKKRCDTCSEVIVFHGLGNSKASCITESNNGYGLQTSGEWGNGWYFNEHANFSNEFAFQSDDNKKELIVALINTGNCLQLEKGVEPLSNSAYDSYKGERICPKNRNISSYSYAVFSKRQIFYLYSISYHRAESSVL